MSERVYSPDGEPFDVPAHKVADLVLNKGWSQSAHDPDATLLVQDVRGPAHDEDVHFADESEHTDDEEDGEPTEEDGEPTEEDGEAEPDEPGDGRMEDRVSQGVGAVDDSHDEAHRVEGTEDQKPAA